jgi:hypothetical protein
MQARCNTTIQPTSSSATHGKTAASANCSTSFYPKPSRPMSSKYSRRPPTHKPLPWCKPPPENPPDQANPYLRHFRALLQLDPFPRDGPTDHVAIFFDNIRQQGPGAARQRVTSGPWTVELWVIADPATRFLKGQWYAVYPSPKLVSAATTGLYLPQAPDFEHTWTDWLVSNPTALPGRLHIYC